MYELNTDKVIEVAEKMSSNELNLSKSIRMTELGECVLTLDEVVQTFD